MQFVHPALAWGFLLALVPLLIHLINLVRRRRIQWAAMDFLLQSYKKHRTWIWLKQFLLLLARMAAVALVVAMLAQWVTQQEWFALLGVTSTHHYVILDDSYSMGDRVGGASAFDRAQQAIGHIAERAVSQETRQKFTLIRCSRAAASAEDADAGSIADLNGEIVDSRFNLLLEEKRRGIDVTELAVGPHAALQVVKQLVAADDEEQEVVYLLSDFREKEWEHPAELKQQLGAVSRAGAEIHFVACSPSQQPNLALVEMQPGSDTRAAGVPFFVHIGVRNFGRRTERKVPVRVRTLFYDPRVAAASQPGQLVAKEDSPPTVLIDEILPGQTVTVRTQVFFPQPGSHVIEAVLPEDALNADNRRWCVVELAESESVLIVDGSSQQRGEYYLSAAFDPGRRTKTGIDPEQQPATFLRDSTPAALQTYRSIYLLDVERLDRRARENLETFVRQGGGLGVFLGDQVDVRRYNLELYRDGEGFFPVPLARNDLLPPEVMENTPDFEVEDHPIFSVFLGEENPFIQWVTIERYFETREGWEGETALPAEVIARLRNRAPLAVERQYGAGRVVAFLTTLAPDWNNWAQDPSFVVALLRLQAYLAAPSHRDERRLVGAPLDVQFDASEFQPEMTFVAPSHDGTPLVIRRTATKPQPDSPLLATALGHTFDRLSGGETDSSGVYEVWANSRKQQRQVRRFSLNVDGDEGDLDLTSSQILAGRLAPLQVRFRRPDQFALEVDEQAGANRSLLLMCLLIALLLGEQLLGYFTGYHPARGVAGG